MASVFDSLPDETEFDYALKDGRTVVVKAKGHVIPGSPEDPTWEVAALQISMGVSGADALIDPRDLLTEWQDVQDVAVQRLCETHYRRAV